MRKIVINGGLPLQGEITISGAKNSVVALIPAIILADDVVTLDCVPDISDVASLVEIMELMGATVKRYDDVLEIDPRGVQNIPMPYGKINSLRASYYFYGSRQLVCREDVILVLVRLTYTLRLLKLWVPLLATREIT